jgi:hypothetical protein
MQIQKLILLCLIDESELQMSQCVDLLHVSFREGARFLWKRIPPDIKKSRPELAALWKIGKNMYLRNYSEIWKALSSVNWSGTVKQFVDVLINSFRARTFELLSKSYTSITPEATANYLGLPVPDTVKCTFQNNNDNNQQSSIICFCHVFSKMFYGVDIFSDVTARGWEEDAQTKMLKPRFEEPQKPATVGIDTLHSLTEYVVHLEKK